MAVHGYAAYKEARVTTASGGRLVVMLYDAAINQCTLALKALEARELEAVHNHLLKAQDILGELTGALDMQYEIAQNLFALYEYCTERLITANVNKAPGPIEEVLGYLTELRDTWEQALRGGTSAASNGGAAEQTPDGPVGIEISG